MLITVAATVFVFGMLVLAHEFGHFITAKLTGMRVSEFAIGFGPKLLWNKRGETEYSLRMIPLGGYNKIDGMDPEEEKDERSFSSKPLWARALVIAAGSCMNFVLPVLLFMMVFLSSGIETVSDKPVIGSLIPGKPAIQSGIASGDTVLKVNGAPVASWRQVVETIRVSKDSLKLEIRTKDGQTRTVTMIPEIDSKSGRSLIGIVPVIDRRIPGFFEAASLSVSHTYNIAGKMLLGLGQMFSGKAEADIAGPIGVMRLTGEMAQLGFIPLLQFAAFLSINLGLINLLPVPLLDGGHIVTLLVEAVRRKPLNANQIRYTQMVGMALLGLLMLFATFKDLLRLNVF
jgi:regulator of sigma E protease